MFAGIDIPSVSDLWAAAKADESTPSADTRSACKSFVSVR